MSIDAATRERIDTLVAEQSVTLFMKGSRQASKCGFSATVVQILDSLLDDYRTVDVLADAALREGIKVYSSWPTIPQLYVGGEFIGGCDIVRELFASGELHEKLGVELAAAEPPQITLTDAAAEGLRRAVEGRPDGDVVHLAVDAGFQASLSVGPRQAGAIELESDGVVISVDPLSAPRADGLVLDAVETPEGTAFRIENPNAPNAVGELAVAELKQLLDAGEAFELLDVRTPEERALASIPGAMLLTEEVARRLEGAPREVMLVFHCHHGGRSRAAAEHFASLGFTNVWNVTGGIDAWSQEVDADIPRY